MRYALVQSDGRRSVSGSLSARQPANSVGQATRFMRDRMWIGSKPYQDPDAEITEIFRDWARATKQSLTSFAWRIASRSVSRLPGNNSQRKNRKRRSPSRSRLSIGVCAMIVVAPTSANRSTHFSTHSTSCAGAIPKTKSLPMSVTNALVGSGARVCKSRQSAQGKIPEIFLPRTEESCPYDLPWPIATIKSIGSFQVWRSVATTVGKERARLLAPKRMTRRLGCGLVTVLWACPATTTSSANGSDTSEEFGNSCRPNNQTSGTYRTAH
jgi:hypothetical protein